MKILKNKIAFVSGGSRGIGAAIVKKLSEQGADVGFSYHSNLVAANETKAQALAYGGKCKTYQYDCSVAEQVDTVMNAFMLEFGRIDILINNTGIIKDNLVGLIPKEDWDSVISVNLTAAFLHTQLAIKSMIRQRSGTIVNISSTSGVYGNAGQANYAASKAGLIGFTKSIAKEVGSRNIRCNAIAPGVIETEMTENIRKYKETELTKMMALRRFGTSDEVAEVALFLSSDQSRYVTGQVINVCGGMY
ncbi:MAG: 3-oxoacyl-[acyl-carrier protein] reductase [Polaribacter sp.]|jgi:3-oxoacyl-[acyl-carrier protein] reductase